MLKFLSTVLLGLIAALVATYFQNKTWHHRNLEEIGQRELKDVISVIEKLSKAVDQRLVAQRRFDSIVRDGSACKEDLIQYRVAIDGWMGEFSSFKSKLYLYFGGEEMRIFEYEVHRNLREASDIILRTYRLGLKNLSKPDAIEYLNVDQKNRHAQYVAFQFLKRLNEKVANLEFGTIQYVNNVHSGKLENISKTYLLLRLFGMKS